jgi:uncharacterized membrane protein
MIKRPLNREQLLKAVFKYKSLFAMMNLRNYALVKIFCESSLFSSKKTKKKKRKKKKKKKKTRKKFYNDYK